MVDMRRRRVPFRAVFWLAATCWLAAGPGGVVVKAALACHHASMVAHHGPGPCFCNRMMGAFDHTVSVALRAVTPVAPVRAAPGVAVGKSARFPLPPSPVPSPETPPRSSRRPSRTKRRINLQHRVGGYARARGDRHEGRGGDKAL